MIFVINGLKYDTCKMELVSDKCEYFYSGTFFYTSLTRLGRDVKLWRSKNGRWLLTYKGNYEHSHAVALTEEEARKYLLKYDVEAYEKTFGELEEA